MCIYLDPIKDGRVISYTFAPLGRLTDAEYSTGESFGYAYDAVGNGAVFTSTTPLSGTLVTTYTFDAANRLTARGVSDGLRAELRAYTYSWSDRGQLLKETTQGVDVRTFTYDGAGRLVEATVFTLTTKFTYNGLGARTNVEVVGQGTTTVTLDYAAGNVHKPGGLLPSRNASGVSARILAETTLTGTVQYLYGHDCLGELRDDEWLYYQHDGDWMVRQGTDADGEVVSTWLFDPDGTVLEGPEGPVSHLICGGVYDWSTGLIYKGDRYFDPTLGIWLALVPLVVVQSLRRKKKGWQWPGTIALALFLVGMSGLLTGCGDGGESPPGIFCFEPSALPTGTVVNPTATPTWTLAPTATSMPTPTGTPTPTSTSTPIPTPMPTGLPPAPAGWQWRLLPLDNPGTLFDITHYNTTVESGFPLEPGGEGVELHGLDLHRQVRKDFALEIMYQGSGYLDLGTGADYNGYINWTSGETLATALYRRTACPETRTGSCAMTLLTGAVSPHMDEREATGLAIWGDNPQGGYGTMVYIENLNLQITVNDTGGAVGKHQIDVYAGLRGGTADRSFVDPPRSRVWRLETAK